MKRLFRFLIMEDVPFRRVDAFKLSLILTLAVLVTVAIGTTWTVPQTAQNQLELFKAATAGDAAAGILALDTNEGNYASMPTGAFKLMRNESGAQSANAGIITMFGTDAALEVFEWKLYGWRRDNGPAIEIANGTATLGSQDVVLYPHDGSTATSAYWCDTITVSNEYWPKDVVVSTAGGNSVAQLGLDTFGVEYLYLEITTTSTAETAGAYISWF